MKYTLQELENQIRKISDDKYHYLLLGNFTEIKKSLSSRTDEDITKISQWIIEIIDIYFDEGLERAKLKAQGLVISKQEDFDLFFYPPANSKDYPFGLTKDEEIIDYFYVNTYENTEGNDAIYLAIDEYGIEIEGVENVYDYEVMAVMALRHIDECLDNYGDRLKTKLEEEGGEWKKFNLLDDYIYICKEASVKSAINACLFVQDSISMRLKNEIKNLKYHKTKEIEKEIIRKNASKGGKKRHEKRSREKIQILKLWEKYRNEEEKPSKNEFAKIMSKSMNIPESVIRKNWLQGI